MKARDHIAIKIIELGNLIASQKLSTRAERAIDYGMSSAARDVRENREEPPDWRTFLFGFDMAMGRLDPGMPLPIRECLGEHNGGVSCPKCTGEVMRS